MKQTRLFLLAALLLSAITSWAQDFVVDGIYYYITGFGTDRVAAVTYKGSDSFSANTYSGDVTIPSSVIYSGTIYPVTYIGSYAFCNCSNLTSVNIPNSITDIGMSAFAGCSSLTSVTIPNSVTSIGGYAFSGCSGLTSINIPNSVRSIGNMIFSGCSSLPVENNLRYAGKYLVEVVDRNCTSAGIKDGTKWIGQGAFNKCSKLESISIPNSVTDIGIATFAGCISLTSITIPNNVTAIGERAFAGCSSLTSVTIPNSMTAIGDGAFYGCSGLTMAEFASIEALCKISFSNYDSNPLYNAHHLYIEGKEITDLVIPNSVTSIAYAAFFHCSSLTSVTIPNSVISIGNSAFYGCSGLSSIICEAEAVPSLGTNALNTGSKYSLYVPEESVLLYKSADVWKNATSVKTLEEAIQIDESYAAPTVTIKGGKIDFSSDMPDAKYVCTIKDAMLMTNKEIEGNSLNISNCYILTVYAKKGYTKSPTTTAYLDKNMTTVLPLGDMNGDGKVDMQDANIIVNQYLGK